MATKERIAYLLQAWTNRTATKAEEQELIDLVNANPDETEFHAHIQSLIDQHDPAELVPAVDWDQLYEKILANRTPKTTIHWWRYAAAAAVFIIVTTAIVFNVNRKGQPIAIVTTSQDASPGQFKARLVLADGTIIVLDSITNGQLATQGKTTVIGKDGKLVYEGNTGEIVYNNVSTSKGETYSLTLADGSIVWLNSASSIKFPVAFTGAERRIEITGEAYFKVAKNPKQPFIVSVNGMTVQALGTEFNVNAYADEATLNTTLIEGSVKVNQATILKPGQQSQVTNSGIKLISDANIEEVIAWKEGMFHFESADLQTILRQLSRWYDIEVIYEKEISHEKYFTIMSRNNTLTNVLKSLQANGVQFKIENKKLYILSE